MPRVCPQMASGTQGGAPSPGWGKDVESRKLGNPAGGPFPRQICRSGRLPGHDACTCGSWDTELSPVRPWEGAGGSRGLSELGQSWRGSGGCCEFPKTVAGAGHVVRKLGRGTPSLIRGLASTWRAGEGLSQHRDHCAWHLQGCP